jgi:hypothetical protein
MPLKGGGEIKLAWEAIGATYCGRGRTLEECWSNPTNLAKFRVGAGSASGEGTVTDYSDRLSHLSDEQKSKLVQRYYSNEPVDKLISEYGINIQVSRLVLTFPAVHLELQCSHCQTRVTARRLSRSNEVRLSAPECPNCGHVEETICSCVNCRALMKQAAESQERIKREKIVETWKPEPTEISVWAYELVDLIQFLA